MAGIGKQAGGVVNVCAFEVGYITENPDLGTRVVVPVGLHPLVVAPSTLRYTDATRSPVQETTGGALKNVAGRALRPIQFSGTFGVESRGVGPYVGTGEVRLKRFLAEVVRMPEVRDRASLEALINPLTGSIGLRTRLAGWDPKRSSFYVNWYDLLNGEAFEVQVVSFSHEIAHRNGGATGMKSYQCMIKEVGPLIVQLASPLRIDKLFAGLRTWGDLNETIKSYSPNAIRASLVEMTEPVATLMSETITAIATDASQVVNLMGGSPATPRATATDNRATSTGSAGVSVNYLARSSSLSAQAQNAVNEVDAASTGEPDAVVGTIAWDTQIGDGDIDELRRFDGRAGLWAVAEAADWQPVAGVLFGLSRAEYVEYVTAQASGGLLGPVLGGSILHTVRDTDTVDSIEREYHISWPTILDVNGLLPDEALVTGQVLKIPTTRARGPQPINGLPVFASHVGKSAWGIDIDLLGRVVDGAPLLVATEDCLSQGVGMIIEETGQQILDGLERIPSEAQGIYVAERVRACLMQDPRIVGVESVDVVLGAQGIEVAATVAALNGGTIRTGGA